MLTTLIAGLASGETMLAVRRARRAAVAYLLAVLAGLCGLGFLVGALYIWAAARYGAVQTALVFGGGFFALAILILIIHRLTATVRARRAVERRATDLKAIGIATALAVLPGLLRSKSGLGALIGPAIALAAYAIYRENSKPAPRGPDAPDD